MSYVESYIDKKDRSSLPPVAVVAIAAPCATAALITALLCGINGALFGMYMLFMGGVCGVPVGYLIKGRGT